MSEEKTYSQLQDSAEKDWSAKTDQFEAARQDAEEKPKFLWWGYLHTSGTLQAKRYFDKRDTDEAEDSPFVQQVVYPFEAANREEALEHIKKQIAKYLK